MEPDLAYLQRRAREEEQAARAATHPDAKQAHRDMADRYAALAQGPNDHRVRRVAPRGQGQFVDEPDAVALDP